MVPGRDVVTSTRNPCLLGLLAFVFFCPISSAHPFSVIACICKEEVHEDFLNIPAVVKKTSKQKKTDSDYKLVEDSPSMNNLFNKISSWRWHGD